MNDLHHYFYFEQNSIHEPDMNVNVTTMSGCVNSKSNIGEVKISAKLIRLVKNACFKCLSDLKPAIFFNRAILLAHLMN